MKLFRNYSDFHFSKQKYKSEPLKNWRCFKFKHYYLPTIKKVSCFYRINLIKFLDIRLDLEHLITPPIGVFFCIAYII